MERHDPSLRARTDERENERQGAERGGRMRRAHLRERVEPVGSSEQAEGQQQ